MIKEISYVLDVFTSPTLTFSKIMMWFLILFSAVAIIMIYDNYKKYHKKKR